jgi:hypothetical protein
MFSTPADKKLSDLYSKRTSTYLNKLVPDDENRGLKYQQPNKKKLVPI